jgi:hypothetical protein
MSNQITPGTIPVLEPVKFDVAVLLPTRGRTTALETSVMSLVNNVDVPEKVQILLGFDDDDRSSLDYFVEHIGPKVAAAGISWQALEFPRLGYARLNEYVSKLAGFANAHWLCFWNDDAIMKTSGWDTKISQHNGKFKCLRMPTHNSHPYAIFPVVPREWYLFFGYLSPHQISDAWISQMSYMLDIMENINVEVLHDRHDLTGNNKDDTYNERIMFENNHTDPRDFNHVNWRRRRFDDANRLAWFLQTQGYDLTWFKDVCAGKQDPWAKMMSPEFDPNQQLAFIDPKSKPKANYGPAPN